MDSHRPRQISQSDCEISSNCGKKSYRPRQISQSGCEISSNCGKKYVFSVYFKGIYVYIVNMMEADIL